MKTTQIINNLPHCGGDEKTYATIRCKYYPILLFTNRIWMSKISDSTIGFLMIMSLFLMLLRRFGEQVGLCRPSEFPLQKIPADVLNRYAALLGDVDEAGLESNGHVPLQDGCRILFHLLRHICGADVAKERHIKRIPCFRIGLSTAACTGSSKQRLRKGMGKLVFTLADDKGDLFPFNAFWLLHMLGIIASRGIHSIAVSEKS